MSATQNTLQASTKSEVQAAEGVERMRARRAFVPTVDILAHDDAVLIRADLPGVDEANLDITLEKNTLTLHASQDDPAQEGYTLAYSEYETGDFERSFTITSEIDREGIEATMEKGVLTLTLPKSKVAQPRKISVQAT